MVVGPNSTICYPMDSSRDGAVSLARWIEIQTGYVMTEFYIVEGDLE